MSAQRFVKKPVEAMQWDGTAESATPIIDWILPNEGWTATYNDATYPDPLFVLISTPFGGAWLIDANDWIVRHPSDGFYPVKPWIFAATYEPVASMSVDTETFSYELDDSDSDCPGCSYCALKGRND